MRRVAATIAAGASKVADGGSLAVTVAFTQVSYTATFSESTLPSGQSWSATVNGVTASLTTDGATDTLYVHQSGMFYLQIDTPCAWHVRAFTQASNNNVGWFGTLL